MAEYTNSLEQTVEANNNVLFTETPVKDGGCIRHREGSGLITLRGFTNSQCRARFLVTFGANVAIPTGGTVGPISVAIALDGEAISSSTMISTPAAVEEFNNISGSIFIDVPRGCCATLSVKNITTDTPILVSNANLIVTREA